MFTGNKTKKFEVLVLAHLDAAYNLARWLMGNEADARDVVQTASLRALTYVESLRGQEAKAWFLGIVRNCCMTAMTERSGHITDVDFESVVNGNDELEKLGNSGSTPELELMRKDDQFRVNEILSKLPVDYREVLILREMEDLAYDQIAYITGAPIGTVMSRLSRARGNFTEA